METQPGRAEAPRTSAAIRDARLRPLTDAVSGSHVPVRGRSRPDHRVDLLGADGVREARVGTRAPAGRARTPGARGLVRARSAVSSESPRLGPDAEEVLIIHAVGLGDS